MTSPIARMQERASYEAGGLDAALNNWLESFSQVRQSLALLISDGPGKRGRP